MGTASHDLMRGGTGDDGIDGKAGNDRMPGGNGQDTLRGRDDADTINGGDRAKGGGRDTVYFVPGQDTVTNCEMFNPPE